MPQFHETVRGQRFFEKQLPDFIKAINRLADAVERSNELRTESTFINDETKSVIEKLGANKAETDSDANKPVYPDRVKIDEALSDDELAIINKFARRNLSKDEVYTFSLILCDNEVDKCDEKFTISALESLAKLFIGKTGILDIDTTCKDCVARIYHTEVLTDSSRNTSDGEVYTYIKAKAYLIRTPDNESLISDIESGIKKETSVGCCVSEVYCSVCGNNVKNTAGECQHQKGKLYNGKPCVYLLSEPSAAYEWSSNMLVPKKNKTTYQK